jgi:asparagine synthase (glutamine-hydrolysing)
MGASALDRMRHRGPDGAGMSLVNVETGDQRRVRLKDTPQEVPTDVPLSDFEPCGEDLLLGHRRLSIFDLSSNGHQPMSDSQGNQVSFNGEIYNFLEIRNELQEKGEKFHTGTDTEVLLAAYRTWGPDCLQKFNGMWAILLYDAADKRLLVSVDRIGEKQLYVCQSGDLLVFASEIKAIEKVVGDQLTLNQSSLQNFLAFGSIDVSEATLWNEIRRFPAGHFACAHPAEFASDPILPYWQIPLEVKRYHSVQEAADTLRSLLDDSIRLRMRSDVPWGTTLSGGLDSSSIIYAAKSIRNKEGVHSPIHTFTAVFPGQKGDESSFVKLIEGDIGTHARYVNPLNEFSMADFERFLDHQDLPVVSTSMYAQWSVMKLVGASEVKVLLDGQGGDELFGGYHHHAYKLGRALLLSGKIRAFNRLVEEFSSLKGIPAATVRKYVWDDVKLYLRMKAGYQLPGPPEATAWNKALSLQSVLIQDLKSWVMPMLLRYEDRNSMAFSVEARLPFLDYRIVEFAMQLPDHYKIHEGWQKYILRLAMPELPEAIRWRKDKKGFTTPHEEWIQLHKKEFLALADVVRQHGILSPIKPSEPIRMNESQLFRMASLGFWLQKSARA